MTLRSSEEFEADVASVEAAVKGRSHDDIYLEGVGLIGPFIGDRPPPMDPERFGRGLALLEYVVRLNPINWAAMWVLGRGYRRANSLMRSADFFARAYALAPDELANAVEYQYACMTLGRIDEAVRLGRQQVALAGGSADAHSNLAAALLLQGDLDAATAEVTAATALAPQDEVINNVRRAIDDVREGRRPQPTSLRDFEGPPTPPPSDRLTPEEAWFAFEEAFTAYRTLLEASPDRIVSQEERDQIEECSGPIQRVEIRATEVELNWTGRTLNPVFTEHTTLVGPKNAVTRDGRLHMRIEAREEGWRATTCSVLPRLRKPDGADPLTR